MKTMCFRDDPEQDLLESCNLQVLLHSNGQVHSDHPLVKYRVFIAFPYTLGLCQELTY